ncbi:MAG: FadR family transcriptional regulator [Kofleriaceae bacterium]|nr:FadR family transcriptional regulator [Kofleriaceae bacterium]
MFAAIQKQSASAECDAALRRAIVSGKLRAGERLPPERALAEQFGVNRQTLRGALAQILALGLVTVKQGSGYTVADLSRVGGCDLLPDVLDLARDSDELLILVTDLLDVRRSMAGSLLARLAKTATEQSLDDISSAIDHFAQLLGNPLVSLAEITEADFSVIAAMIDGAQSPIMRLCLNPIIAATAEIDQLTAAMYAEPQSNVAGHTLLLQWLREPSLAPLSLILETLADRDAKTIARMSKQLEKS